MERFFAVAGSVAAMIGVIVGAFGAHGLQGRVTPADLEIFETGVRYHMYHALGLFAVAWAASRWPSGATTLAGMAVDRRDRHLLGKPVHAGPHGATLARSRHACGWTGPDRGLGRPGLGCAA